MFYFIGIFIEFVEKICGWNLVSFLVRKGYLEDSCCLEFGFLVEFLKVE